MSTLTKVFLVLTFLLAATFLTFTLIFFSQHDSWMLTAENWYRQTQESRKRHEADVARLTEIVAGREREITQLKDQEAMARSELNQQVQALATTQLELGQTRRELRLLENVHAQVVSDIQRVRQQNRELQAERQAAMQARQEAEDRAALALSSYHEVESVNTSLRAENDELTRRLSDVQNSYNEARLILDDMRARGLDVGTDLVAVPTIRGKVMEVDLEHGIVILDVGAHDLVQNGYEFKVYRGEEFLGRVRVTNVFDDAAACDLIEPATGAAIRKGDDATTHWRY